jgi:hypothetical protein
MIFYVLVLNLEACHLILCRRQINSIFCAFCVSNFVSVESLLAHSQSDKAIKSIEVLSDKFYV